ncbi:hypothetical protein HD554DRAFT_226334 [Boletus coccyginus]|nr:hypothetical protein HD554DRAFT_226334 [Boletus coccyginus]
MDDSLAPYTIYMNSEHIVFDLVPPALGAAIEECYMRIGSPPVTRDSVWTVYSTLLRTLQLQDHVQTVLSNMNEPLEEINEIGLLPGLQELQENDEGYMGGVANGLGFRDLLTFIQT